MPTVSALLFEGHKQNQAFKKPVGRSADERHHVRFWLMTTPDPDGRSRWLGAASFDRGVGISHDTGEITHHIGPDLDADRDLVIGDLWKAGQVSMTYEVNGVGATKTGRNGGGDPYFTDGKAVIGVLKDMPPISSRHGIASNRDQSKSALGQHLKWRNLNNMQSPPQSLWVIKSSA